MDPFPFIPSPTQSRMTLRSDQLWPFQKSFSTNLIGGAEFWDLKMNVSCPYHTPYWQIDDGGPSVPGNMLHGDVGFVGVEVGWHSRYNRMTGDAHRVSPGPMTWVLPSQSHLEDLQFRTGAHTRSTMDSPFPLRLPPLRRPSYSTWIVTTEQAPNLLKTLLKPFKFFRMFGTEFPVEPDLDFLLLMI